MTVYFDLSFQNQTINPSVGTYSSSDGVTPSFELVDNEYYLKNIGSYGYYHFNIANIPNDVVIEFDLVFNNKNSFNWVFLFESTNSNWWGIYNNDSALKLGGASLSDFTLASNITNGTKYHVTLISQYNTSGNIIKIYLNNNLVLTTVITTAHERSQFLLLGNTINYTSNCYIKDILITDLSTDTTKYLNGTGLSEMWTNTKNYIASQLLGKSDVGHTHSASDITSGLSTVATSGSYNDLSNKPTIPSKTSDLTNDSGFITSDNTKIPLAGSNQISGSLIPATDNSVNLGDSTYGFANFYTNKIYLKDSTIFKLVDDNYICIGGSTAQANGANLVLNGKNRSTSTGEFKLEARDGTNVKQLIGKPNGILSWNGDIITNGSGVYDLGDTNNGFKNIYFNNEHSKVYYGGTTLSLRSTGNGAGCGLGYGAFYPSSDNAWSLGGSSIRWTQLYASSSTISTSDERQKDNIKQIDDKLLQAWGNVNIVQFNFKDALEKKGENARLHTGYIAQNIQQACEENGVNPNDYGLFCHDSWEEQEEKKDEKGEVIEPYRAKGDLYSLRYEEALVVECAYLRKCIKELRNEIEELKSSK